MATTTAVLRVATASPWVSLAPIGVRSSPLSRHDVPFNGRSAALPLSPRHTDLRHSY